MFNLILLIIPQSLSAQAEIVEVDWVQHYGSQQLWSEDEANALVIDDEGNSYVTGYGREGIITFKYQADGTEAWHRTIEDGYIYTSYCGKNLAVDDLGNIYVAFENQNDGGLSVVKYTPDGSEAWTASTGVLDSANGNAVNLVAFELDAQGNTYLAGDKIVKFDTAGQLAWLSIYNGAPTDLSVDMVGNVYVTGRRLDNSSEWDYCTTKYDTDGNEVWTTLYNGSGNDWDLANSIAVDVAGNVFVTGQSENEAGDGDMTTIKYDSNGTLLWEQHYDGPAGNQHDFGSDLELDDSGNVYVAGSSIGSSWDNFDFITVKYSNEGAFLWGQRYASPDGGRDELEDLTLDNMNNVVVTGNMANGATTIKYNSDGVELWVSQTYPEGMTKMWAMAVATSNSGAIQIVGISVNNDWNTDFCTITFDTDGNYEWSAIHDGPGRNLDWSNDMVLDSGGNIYITGACGTYGDSDVDCITLKYLADGSLDWINVYPGPGRGENEGQKIALSPSGNVVVSGSNLSYDDGSMEICTVVYSAEGEQLWVAVKGDLGAYSEIGALGVADLAIDNAGNVIITGTGAEEGVSGGVPYYQTIKYDPDGNELWQEYYNPQNQAAVSAALALDETDNVFVTGWTTDGAVLSESIVTLKYNSDGELLWERAYNIGAESLTNVPTDIAIGPGGNIYITGYCGQAVDQTDWATIMYSTEGDQIWATNYTGTGDGMDIPNVIKVDQDGNVYVAGSSMGLLAEDYTTLKYDPSGNQSWEAHYDAPAYVAEWGNIDSHDRITDLTLDIHGNVYVSGTTVYYGFLGWVTEEQRTIRYNPDGSEAWQIQHDEPANDEAHSILVDGQGNVIVSGSNWIRGQWDIPVVESQFTTIKYIQPEYPVSVGEKVAPEFFRLNQNYPNPFNPTTTIQYSLPEAGTVKLTIFDIQGQEIMILQDAIQPAGNYGVLWSGCDQQGKQVSTGLFFCRLEAGKESHTIKMLMLK